MRLTERAREMRKNPTKAEAHLWKHLRNKRLGVKFRRQEPVGFYIADFLCEEHRLIVEVDGSQHKGSEYDKARDAWLNAAGYRVIRFWNNEVLTNVDGVLQRVQEHFKKPESKSI
jgi:very-short-patch-repair endonuclease